MFTHLNQYQMFQSFFKKKNISVSVQTVRIHQLSSKDEQELYLLLEHLAGILVSPPMCETIWAFLTRIVYN